MAEAPGAAARHMRQALELAARGLGRTSPNPPVGAVVVSAAGVVIGRGYHHRAGEPHAERLALREAGSAARGGELYCTLEPCCHYGRTPPCTDAIVRAGVRRVFYASEDPDLRCAGRGAAALREQGIEVYAGLLAEQTDCLLEAYFKHKRQGVPFLTLKLACSLDGKVATASGDARWVSGEVSRSRVHTLRDQADAVMVGVGTVLTDDPQLTARAQRVDDRQPVRVIVDSQARTPSDANVLASEGRCVIAATEQAPGPRLNALRQAGAEVITLPAAAGHVDLPALMAWLGRQDIMSVLCEGGPILAASLVAGRLVDKYLLFYAPRFVGEEGRSALAELGLQLMSQSPRGVIDGIERLGDDFLVTVYPCSPD